MRPREIKRILQRALMKKYGMAPILRDIDLRVVHESGDYDLVEHAIFRVNDIPYIYDCDINLGESVRLQVSKCESILYATKSDVHEF